MKSMEKWLLGAAFAGIAMASVDARAATETKEKGKGRPCAPGASVSAGVSLGGESAASAREEHAEHGDAEKGKREGHEEGKEEGEEEEKRLSLGIDFVLGFGKTDVLSQSLPGSFATVPDNNVGAATMTTESFIASAGYELGKGFGIGVRLPFSFGSFTAPGQSTRGTNALGNLELEGEWEHKLSTNLELVLALGVALPTAQGDEVPSAAEAKDLGVGADINAYDRFALNKAVSSSRGFEESALYEPKHLGLIPKVGLEWHASPKLNIEPYVKLENLIATVKGQAHGYTGELILGARAGYLVSKQFEPGLRLWMNAPVSGADFTTVAVVEPELRFHFDSVTPMVGVILPFAGSLTDPQFVGVRAGISAKF